MFGDGPSVFRTNKGDIIKMILFYFSKVGHRGRQTKTYEQSWVVKYIFSIQTVFG